MSSPSISSTTTNLSFSSFSSSSSSSSSFPSSSSPASLSSEVIPPFHSTVHTGASSATHTPFFPGSVRLYLLRHAESEFNTSPHLIGGQTNSSPLTKKGERQAVALGKRLHYEQVKFDAIYTSTATRTIQTAQHALAQMNVPLKFTSTESLLEQSQGDWEGKHREEVYSPHVRKLMEEMHMDFRAPGGESLRDVQKRAITYLFQELNKWSDISINEKREVCLAIFTHGGVIRSLLHYYLNSNDRWTWLMSVENTSLSEISLTARGVSLVRVNDAAHLWLHVPTSTESNHSQTNGTDTA